MLSSSEKKTFKLETGGGTGHYQAIVVLELEGCRIFSIEEIRQDLIDLLTVTITIQPAQYRQQSSAGCVVSESRHFGKYLERERERETKQAERWLC